MKPDKIKFFNISELDNMVINILEEGKENVLKEIEKINNPIKRSKQRNLYYLAIEKINF